MLDSLFSYLHVIEKAAHHPAEPVTPQLRNARSSSVIRFCMTPTPSRQRCAADRGRGTRRAGRRRSLRHSWVPCVYAIVQRLQQVSGDDAGVSKAAGVMDEILDLQIAIRALIAGIASEDHQHDRTLGDHFR